MGFRVQIQADYGNEVLQNVHPEGKPSGGKAVLAFLMGLQGYCDWQEEDGGDKHNGLQAVVEWYRLLEQSTGVLFCRTCRALLDCMWGDGGDPTEYREDEYEFFRKRRSSVGGTITEIEFQAMVRQSGERWQSIVEVAQGVQLLLDVFRRSTAKPLDGFYEPTDTISDFEALAANLDLLVKRGNKLVRLNFN